jgi:hypothetical protein
MGNQNNILKTTITPITDEALLTSIKTDLINPTYFSDIKTNLQGRTFWKTTGEITDAFSKIFTGVAAIIAFAAGFFGYTVLAFIAGCFSTASLVLNHFSSYAMVQSKQHTDEVNEELSKLGLDNIVNIAPDPVSSAPTTPVTPNTPIFDSEALPSSSIDKFPPSSKVSIASNGIVPATSMLTIEDELVVSPKSELKDATKKDDITSSTIDKPSEPTSKSDKIKTPAKTDPAEEKSDQVINV